MKKLLIILIVAAITFSITSKAQTTTDPLLQNLEFAAKKGAGYTAVSESTIPNMIGQIVAIVLSFVGAIFFIIIIYSGIQWMTAGGNEETVKKARTRLINGTIGLAITVAAYFITWLISTTLLGT